MKKNQKSKIAYVDFPVGENSSLSNPTTKTIIHDGKTYYCHPNCENYVQLMDTLLIVKN